MRTAAAIVLVLAGCASGPPPPVATMRAVALAPEATRTRALEALIASGLAIRRSEAGVITAERIHNDGGAAIARWAACDSPGAGAPPPTYRTDVTVRVRPAAGGASVTVNARFGEVRPLIDEGSWGVLPCASRGVLETTILDTVGEAP